MWCKQSSKMNALWTMFILSPLFINNAEFKNAKLDQSKTFNCHTYAHICNENFRHGECSFYIHPDVTRPYFVKCQQIFRFELGRLVI